jgi:putative CocE/NonD family hydrolase
VFFPKSWSQLNPAMKSEHAAWETPDPGYWTSQGYIVVRVDERGTGQSPGELDTMSRGTSEAFFDVVEWCAEQEWSTGKVGLLGISYFAGTQWRVAARRPKGLAAIIPWEGMSDYYRDRVRHGGILSDKFISKQSNATHMEITKCSEQSSGGKMLSRKINTASRVAQLRIGASTLSMET